MLKDPLFVIFRHLFIFVNVSLMKIKTFSRFIFLLPGCLSCVSLLRENWYLMVHLDKDWKWYEHSISFGFIRHTPRSQWETEYSLFNLGLLKSTRDKVARNSAKWTIMKFFICVKDQISFSPRFVYSFIRKVTVIKGNKNPITTHQRDEGSSERTRISSTHRDDSELVFRTREAERWSC